MEDRDHSLHRKKSEILYGSENAVERGVEFMLNTIKRMDITFDSKGPFIVTKISQYRDGYTDILKRGGTIRCITEVTVDNLLDCKELVNLVTELRHLDGMKGGIAVNESEYMATTILEEGKPLTEVIYSNAKEVVAQGQYLFDTFWKNAIPASKKIKEIEEGGAVEFKTQILSKSDGSLNEIELSKLMFSSKEINIVATTGGLKAMRSLIPELVKDAIERKKRSSYKDIRILVELSKDNLDLVLKFIDLGVYIRHLDKEPSIYFAVTESDLLATIERLDNKEEIESLLYSNEPSYIARFKSMFERLWRDARPVKDIVSIIQKDEEISYIDTIQNPERIFFMVKELISSTNREMLGILPSYDSFRRQVESGIFEHIRQMTEKNKEKEIAVRILVTDKMDLEKERMMDENIIIGNKDHHSLSLKLNNIVDRNGPHKTVDFTTDAIKNIKIRFVSSSSLRSQIGLIVIDKNKSLIIEPKKSKSCSPLDYLGLASFSNSAQISNSYASLFETLWNHSKIYSILGKSYEDLQIHDKMQKEFIDIVAHELRTPLQSIIGLTELAKARIREEESKDLLERVTESGSKLHNFIENILTATKLEGNISNIPKEVFDLSRLILDIVKIYQNKSNNLNQSSMLSYTKQIDFALQGLEKEYKIKANRLQISMVLTNILDNAINFISAKQKGLISTTVERKENEVIVHIKDNGEGIDPDILPRLFRKFSTKSFYGSGLGLYNCRKIIQLHKGKIWAQNNTVNNGEEEGEGEEGGATFSFSLPIAG